MNKKAFKKDGTIYAFEKPNRFSSNLNVSSYPKEVGVIKSYYYNQDQGILFLYIPSIGSSTAWFPISAIEKFK